MNKAAIDTAFAGWRKKHTRPSWKPINKPQPGCVLVVEKGSFEDSTTTANVVIHEIAAHILGVGHPDEICGEQQTSKSNPGLGRMHRHWNKLGRKNDPTRVTFESLSFSVNFVVLLMYYFNLT